MIMAAAASGPQTEVFTVTMGLVGFKRKVWARSVADEIAGTNYNAVALEELLRSLKPSERRKINAICSLGLLTAQSCGT